MKWIALLALLALAACGEPKTTPIHIRAGERLCATNGGVESLTDTAVARELESCGFRCVRQTGRVVHTGHLRCVNGAAFELKEVQ